MKKQMVFSVVYGVIGIGIIGLWIMLIGTNQVPEFETEPVGIVFHIIIEITMALFALVTAWLLYKSASLRFPILLLTNGLLMYSVVNSAGYYGDAQNYSMIALFAIILAFVIYTSIDTINIMKNPTNTK
ncbi:hypothetical protein [Candidatus Xianfuyuplasma coldseepsis]|uniref:DUF8058 domain-containing protein n=1 Tax=Candidatus Xianfuyuplasma coldseepsis TaxID=2782163 RepID=A0A7L7KS50_9MOLU|nr:hypothetical protein [Xianfuyuplasma coldseepsis]QMS85650.1 hypothetical protein G4Z02_07805 [Xianfuyuplasma coldseepsis]